MKQPGVGAPPIEQEAGDDSLVLNMRQVAKRLDICLQKVYDLMYEQPPLPTIKFGTRRVVRKAALEQWLIAREHAQNG